MNGAGPLKRRHHDISYSMYDQPHGLPAPVESSLYGVSDVPVLSGKRMARMPVALGRSGSIGYITEPLPVNPAVAVSPLTTVSLPISLLIPTEVIGYLIGAGGMCVREIEKVSSSILHFEKSSSSKASHAPTSSYQSSGSTSYKSSESTEASSTAARSGHAYENGISEKLLCVYGTHSEKAAALEMILKRLYSLQSVEATPLFSSTIGIPYSSIALLIGNKGITINTLSQKSNCQILVHKDRSMHREAKPVTLKASRMEALLTGILMVYDFLEEYVSLRRLDVDDFYFLKEDKPIQYSLEKRLKAADATVKGEEPPVLFQAPDGVFMDGSSAASPYFENPEGSVYGGWMSQPPPHGPPFVVSRNPVVEKPLSYDYSAAATASLAPLTTGSLNTYSGTSPSNTNSSVTPQVASPSASLQAASIADSYGRVLLPVNTAVPEGPPSFTHPGGASGKPMFIPPYTSMPLEASPAVGSSGKSVLNAAMLHAEGSALYPPLPYGRASNSTSFPHYPFKFVISSDLAAWVVGKGGEHIRDIKRETDATIHVSDTKSVIMGLKDSERLVTVTGSIQNKIQALHLLVLPLLQRFGPVKKSLKILIPLQSVSFLIGYRGTTINSITAESAAEVNIEKSMDLVDGERVVTIVGNPDTQFTACLLLVEKLEAYFDPRSSGGEAMQLLFPRLPPMGDALPHTLYTNGQYSGLPEGRFLKRAEN